MELTFYDFWRSSSAFRVRIALNLKGVDFRGVEVDLAGGEQTGEGYRAVNPLGLVPALDVDGRVITQSLAIIDWLDRQFPAPPLFPSDPLERAQVMGMALTIAADTQPLQNMRVQKHLREALGADKDQVAAWNRHWIGQGLAALEAQAPADGLFGGDAPNVVDIYLVPQMVNARTFDVPMEPLPRLVAIDSALRELPAFAQAAPDAMKPG